MIFWGGTDSRQWICFGQAVSYVFWRVLPLYPTLRSYVKVLLILRVFVMFWNSVKITVGVLAGQILVGVPAAWGFARYRFPGKICCL